MPHERPSIVEAVKSAIGHSVFRSDLKRSLVVDCFNVLKIFTGKPHFSTSVLNCQTAISPISLDFVPTVCAFYMEIVGRWMPRGRIADIVAIFTNAVIAAMFHRRIRNRSRMGVKH